MPIMNTGIMLCRISSTFLPVALLVFVALSVPLFSQPLLETRDVITGLWVPWDMVWGPDNHIWLTERPGMVSRIDPETGERKEILNIRHRVAESHEAGMLGLELHPDMADTPYVYLVHTFWREDDILERLVRYTYDAERDTLIDERVLLDNIPGALFHVGSRVAIGPDRKLYMTTGDAGVAPLAQDHTSLSGKVLRMNLDATVPADNPWAEAPWPSCLIWTTGHRNPQGLTFSPEGTLYLSEHGMDDNDELNIIHPGRNYGWPNANGFCDDTATATLGVDKRKFCSDSNVVEPIMAWTPTIAPAGLAYYTHSAIPHWTNSLLLMTLGRLKPELPPSSYALVQFTLSEDGQRVVNDTAYFANEFGRLRGICIAPDGRVFISTSNRDGRAAPEHGFPREGDDRIIEITWNTSSVEMDRRRMEFRIIPMPVGGDATITFAEVMGRGTVALFDESGRKVRSDEFPGGAEYRFHRAGLPAGRYFLRIDDGKQVVDCGMVVR